MIDNTRITTVLLELKDARAANRKSALKKIGSIKITSRDKKEEVVDRVIETLDDSSVIVARQAVQTLALLGISKVPDELKILYHTTEDQKTKTLILSTIRRIELEQHRKKTGEVEWNMDDFVFSVSDFIGYINELLRGEVVSIKGEVSDINIFRESLVFFTLKDSDGVLNCWFPRASQYKWNVELSDGMEIVVKVRPQVSPRSGRFGLRVLEMSLSGEGSLRLALKKRKEELKQEGLFDPARKRQLPFLPEQIGLISGEDSAAYSDFVKVLAARMGGININFAPVLVQGVRSIAEICGAIRYFNEDRDPSPDLIVLTRGGGSLEDLQSFNSEEVSRAVFSSRIPIVVAVGHEKDWSLAELAADLRASTPSNAAELITPNRGELRSTLQYFVESTDHSFDRLIIAKKNSIASAINLINSKMQGTFAKCYRVIDSLQIYFSSFMREYDQKKSELDKRQSEILPYFQKYYRLRRDQFTTVFKLLRSYSPKNTLKRGYSVVKSGDRIIKSAKDVQRGEKIEVYPYSGKITGEVREVEV